MISCERGKDEREETPGITRSKPSLEEDTKKSATTTTLDTKSVLGRRVIKTSLKHGSNEAELVEKDGTYQLRPELISTYPFSAVTYIIPNGPYKGRQALVLDPVPLKKRRLDFMDFPGEIRNRIYGYALLGADFETANHEIRINQDKRKFVARKRGLPATNTIALLRVSKQVSREAATILYGFGAFWFSSTMILSLFLPAIGKTNTKYLTNVAINFHVAKYAKPVGRLLQHATLRRLNIDCHEWDVPMKLTGEPWMDEFVRDFLPVLKVIHRTRGSTRFLDIVTMAKPALPTCASSQHLDCDEPGRWERDDKLVCEHPECRKLRGVMWIFKRELERGEYLSTEVWRWCGGH